MEAFGGSGFGIPSSISKKRRSTTARRPRPDSQLILENRDLSSHSSTPSSDNGSKMSSDHKNGFEASMRRKELHANSSSTRHASVNKFDGTGSSRKIKKEDRKYGDLSGIYGTDSFRGGQHGRGSDLRRCSEGVLAPANRKGSSKAAESFPDGHAGIAAGSNAGSSENKLKKVKLKVVNRTINSNSNSEKDNSGSNAKLSRDASKQRHKLVAQDNSDDSHTPREKGARAQGNSWRDTGGGFPRMVKEDSGGKESEDGSGNQLPIPEPVRKSKRVPKRRNLDGVHDEDNGDDELRYLEKLKNLKTGTEYPSELEDEEEEESAKKKNVLKVTKSKRTGYNVDGDYSASRSSKENRKRLRAGRGSDDTDFIDDEEPASDAGIDPMVKKQRKESVETQSEPKSEPLTTRQRAFQSGKDASSFIEFPNGLPPTAPRKQKEKLSEVEQAAKKAEAAQRRKMQVEKANKELEAEAIRKILGQDSNRKKKEEKMRKERDEIAQKKAADILVLDPNTVRWVMGPSGTTVTFGEEIGLPCIFTPQTRSYPQPREKCAGPSCTNTYRYRDSKLNIPLCSLQCYKAVRESNTQLSTC